MELTKSLNNNEDFLDEIQQYFQNPNRNDKTSKSLNILLLDPRITDDIPANADIMQPFQSGLYPKFRKAIFFVGTENRLDIYSHLNEARSLWKENNRKSRNPKTQHILDIWSEHYGVICLQVFETSLLKQSITYQAAIIDFIGPSNLKNEEVVQYHDGMAGWPDQKRRELGSRLLSDAYEIYVNSGEQQLRFENI